MVSHSVSPEQRLREIAFTLQVYSISLSQLQAELCAVAARLQRPTRGVVVNLRPHHATARSMKKGVE